MDTRRQVLATVSAVTVGIGGCFGNIDSDTDEPGTQTNQNSSAVNTSQDAPDESEGGHPSNITAKNDDPSTSEERGPDPEQNWADEPSDEQPGDTEEQSEDTEEQSGGTVVVVYDDGPMQDFTQAFPIHEEFGYPATVGIVPSWMGRTDFMGDDWMDTDQLNVLANAGWEIQSHTTSHAVLGEYQLVMDAEEADTRVYLEHDRLGLHQSLPVEIRQGDRSERKSVVGRGSTDDRRYYIEFEEPLANEYSADAAYMRYPEEILNEQITDSRETLEGYGYEVDTLLAPYDWINGLGLEIVRSYYSGVANVQTSTPINPKPFDPFDTSRRYFVEFTTSETTKSYLDQIANEHKLGVFGAHSWKDEVSPDRIREFLGWVEERELEVITLTEAITTYGQ